MSSDIFASNLFASDVEWSDGWLNAARCCPSPNFNERPETAAVDLLVIHSISLPPGVFGGGEIEAFFQNRLDFTTHPYFDQLRGMEVSAHFLIRRNGELIQFVSCDQRAWHAGKSVFGGRENCNDFSIGVELEGTDDNVFSAEQYRQLVVLTKLLMNVYPALTVERIVGHSDIAPGRKTDPGPAFDWVLYREALV